MSEGLKAENEVLRDRLDHTEHALRHIIVERDALRRMRNAEVNALLDLEHECRLRYHPECMENESDERIVGMLCKINAIRRTDEARLARGERVDE